MRRNRSQFPIAALDANPRALHEDVAIGEKSPKKLSFEPNDVIVAVTDSTGQECLHTFTIGLQ
jgi:hypothetical protein